MYVGRKYNLHVQYSVSTYVRSSCLHSITRCILLFTIYGISCFSSQGNRNIGWLFIYDQYRYKYAACVSMCPTQPSCFISFLSMIVQFAMYSACCRCETRQEKAGKVVQYQKNRDSYCNRTQVCIYIFNYNRLWWNQRCCCYVSQYFPKS